MIRVRIEDCATGIPVVTHKSVTKKELYDLKKQARSYKPVDWSTYPEDVKHIIFYAELRDYEDNPYYANIYINGANLACTEKFFEEHYQRPRLYVVAKHRS